MQWAHHSIFSTGPSTVVSPNHGWDVDCVPNYGDVAIIDLMGVVNTGLSNQSASIRHWLHPHGPNVSPDPWWNA